MKLPLLIIALLLPLLSSAASFHLPGMFSDNMVLQRDMAVPVWGTASPGGQVSVRFMNQAYDTKADANGDWQIKLAPQAAGGPYIMTVTYGDMVRRFNNVMIGEVWVFSGQSNMTQPVGGWPGAPGKYRDQTDNHEQEIAAANYPNIRLFQVERTPEKTPQTEVRVDGGIWRECSPETVPHFSALAYYFGQTIYRDLNIPIGLIHSSVGGSQIQYWIPRDGLRDLPDFADEIKALENPEWYEAFYQKQLQEWETKILTNDQGAAGSGSHWADLKYDSSDWKVIADLRSWKDPGIDNFGSISWYRREITLTKDQAKSALRVDLGEPGGRQNIVYFNGKEIGRNRQGGNHSLVIPANTARAGGNVLTVRAIGGASRQRAPGAAESGMTLTAGSQQIPLAGKWSVKQGLDLKQTQFREPRRADSSFPLGALYNGMIAPLMPYGIRGVVWYQGEFNTGNALQYRQLLPSLISSWRKAWRQGDFPFYYVQLPAIGRQPDTLATKSDWAELREAQLMTLSVPNTAMAVTIDITKDTDLHPHNKRDFGERTAQIPLARDYGRKAAYVGPLYKSHVIEGNRVRITFSNPEVGLKARDGQGLQGFVMAGKDQVFHAAEALVDGNTVVVTCKDVTAPMAVRYAWANWPLSNLVGNGGIPASPFRTDNWDISGNK